MKELLLEKHYLPIFLSDSQQPYKVGPDSHILQIKKQPKKVVIYFFDIPSLTSYFVLVERG